MPSRSQVSRVFPDGSSRPSDGSVTKAGRSLPLGGQVAQPIVIAQLTLKNTLAARTAISFAVGVTPAVWRIASSSARMARLDRRALVCWHRPQKSPMYKGNRLLRPTQQLLNRSHQPIAHRLSLRTTRLLARFKR